jgi:oligosaccharide reducing-end xylanase
MVRAPRRPLGSICVIASCAAALTAAACGSDAVQGTPGSGGTASGSAGSNGGASAGSSGSGQGGTVGTAGNGSSGSGGSVGPGDAGTSGAAGSGSGGMSSGSAGATGNGGRGGTTGTVGRGGAAGTGTGAGGRGGAAGARGGAGGSATGGSISTGGSAAGVSGGGGVTTPGMDCVAPASYANLFVTVSGHTQADSDMKVMSAYASLFNAGGSGSIYFNGPGSDESYVEDTYNNDVRTEGMSYGMMIAVQLNDQTKFDRLWTFVKNHMAQGTGQIAWHVSTGGSKLATGGAPDGDEYFATALIFAHNRWGDTSGKYNYATEAQWVLNLLRTMEFNKTYTIVEFYAGAGNTDGSYILPAFYQVWACFDTANAAFWNTAVTAGRNWFHSAINSNGVIPDQSAFTNGSSGGAGADTIRCVANIMMDHNFFNADPWQTDTYAMKYGAYETSHSSGVAQQSCDSLLGFGLPASSGKAFVDKLWSINTPGRDYWNGVLYMLALLHVSGNFHLYY